MDLNIDREKMAQEIAEQGLVPTGLYEVIINNVREDATPSGAEFLGFRMIIRNDLDNAEGLENTNGKYHNRVVLFRQFKSKQTNDYSDKAMSRIAYAAGASGHIGTMQEFINAIEGRAIRAYIKLEDVTKQDGSSIKVNNASPFAMNVTNFSNINHKFNSNQQSSSNMNANPSPNGNNDGFNSGNPFNTPNNNGAPTVSDDDLPF